MKPWSILIPKRSEADCGLVFAREEWQVAYLLLYQKPPPDKSLTLQHLIQIITQ